MQDPYKHPNIDAIHKIQATNVDVVEDVKIGFHIYVSVLFGNIR